MCACLIHIRLWITYFLHKRKRLLLASAHWVILQTTINDHQFQSCPLNHRGRRPRIRFCSLVWQYFGNSASHKNVDVNSHRSPWHPLRFPKGRCLSALWGGVHPDLRRLLADVSVSVKVLSEKVRSSWNTTSEKPSHTPAGCFYYFRKVCGEKRQLRLLSVQHWAGCSSRERTKVSHSIPVVHLSNFIFIVKTLPWAVR